MRNELGSGYEKMARLFFYHSSNFPVVKVIGPVAQKGRIDTGLHATAKFTSFSFLQLFRLLPEIPSYPAHSYNKTLARAHDSARATSGEAPSSMVSSVLSDPQW